MDYSKTVCVLWGAVQNLVNEVIHLKGEITKLKSKHD